MALNRLAPTNLTNVLIGDPADFATATPTLVPPVTGVPVAASLELQSIDSALLVNRMTTAQMNALTPVVDGMIVYDTDAIPGGAFYGHQNGVWAGLGGALQSTTVTFTNLQILSLRSVVAPPVTAVVQSLPILAAPPAGSAYYVAFAALSYSYAGGPAYMNAAGCNIVVAYGTPLPAAAGLNALGSAFPGNILTTANSSLTMFSNSGGTSYTLVGASAAQNKPITLSLTGVSGTNFFTAGSPTSTVTISLLYSVIPLI